MALITSVEVYVTLKWHDILHKWLIKKKNNFDERVHLTLRILITSEVKGQ